MRKPARLPIETLQPFFLPTPPPGPSSTLPRIAWRAVFGNDHPVEIEVGSGKALFLLRTATENPDTNFLGIEIIRKYQFFIATRVYKAGLANVRVACADARLLLRDSIESETVRRVHVYFPDPWWKLRHHKRRVFTPEFAQQCWRILEPNGELLVATDVEDYSKMVKATVAGNTPFTTVEAPPEHEPSHDMDYMTNFERKFRQQGKSIYRMRYTKAGVPPASV